MVIGHTLMTNSFSPDFCCISILCSGAACPNKPALTLQPLFSSVAMTARISVRDGELHGLWNEFILTEMVCKRQALSAEWVLYTPRVWMCVCVCAFFLFSAHCGLSCLRASLLCACACVCMYVCAAKRLGTEQTFCSWQQWAPFPACTVYGCESELH